MQKRTSMMTSFCFGLMAGFVVCYLVMQTPDAPAPQVVVPAAAPVTVAVAKNESHGWDWEPYLMHPTLPPKIIRKGVGDLDGKGKKARP
ncbi:MAG: hypothetical protein AB1705_14380 [Verrucomicrobiota bacterium]